MELFFFSTNYCLVLQKSFEIEKAPELDIGPSFSFFKGNMNYDVLKIDSIKSLYHSFRVYY